MHQNPLVSWKIPFAIFQVEMSRAIFIYFILHGRKMPQKRNQHLAYLVQSELLTCNSKDPKSTHPKHSFEIAIELKTERDGMERTTIQQIINHNTSIWCCYASLAFPSKTKKTSIIRAYISLRSQSCTMIFLHKIFQLFCR